jgi:hypothetical protein
MHKRYLDCSASELISISKKDLLDALRASEGRIVVSETIGAVQPLLHTITNAELAASQGADLLLLNMLDVNNPVIQRSYSGRKAYLCENGAVSQQINSVEEKCSTSSFCSGILQTNGSRAQ